MPDFDKHFDILKAVRYLTSTQVLVGVPSDNEPHLGADVGPNQRKDEGSQSTPLTNAELAYLHSNGVPERNIPARPFLQPGIDTVKDKILAIFEHAAKAALDGNTGEVDQSFDAVGLLAQGAVRGYIAAGIPPPLKPATIAARRRRTKGSSYKRPAGDTVPLIDTAQLLHSISYVKRKV